MSPAEDIRPPQVRLGPAHKRMEPLWDRVDRNRFKLALTVLVFVLGTVIGLDAVLALLGLPFLFFATLNGTQAQAAALLGTVLAWASGIAAVLALAWTGVGLSRSERWLLRRLGATIVPKGDELPAKHALKDMALAAGITPAPAFYVLETGNVNAFVFAASRRRPVVGVTRGFLDRLSAEEERAVFANLVARLRSGDTIYATGVTALTRPLWYVRDSQLRASAEEDSAIMLGGRPASREAAAQDAEGPLGWFFIVAAVFVAVTEIAAFGSRHAQLRQAEVADAEGMLLLKEPKAMLSALEMCIRFNNFVPTAGPAFAQLFYCWTGDATSDEEDPEWQRVIRLREVLGVEGLPPEVTPNFPQMVVAPPPPRLED